MRFPVVPDANYVTCVIKLREQLPNGFRLVWQNQLRTGIGEGLKNEFPNIGTTRTAILADGSVEIKLVDSFMRVMRFPNTRIRFFRTSRRDDAVTWLLRDD